MSTIRIRCELCGETIGTADTDTLRRPMRGSMFASIDPWHDFPAPFESNTEWVGMKCPYGNHRPFINEDSVLDERMGRWAVEYPEPPKPIMDLPDEIREITGGLIDLGIKFAGKEEIERIKSDPDMQYTCGICSRSFSKSRFLASHMRSHQ